MLDKYIVTNGIVKGIPALGVGLGIVLAGGAAWLFVSSVYGAMDAVYNWVDKVNMDFGKAGQEREPVTDEEWEEKGVLSRIWWNWNAGIQGIRDRAGLND